MTISTPKKKNLPIKVLKRERNQKIIIQRNKKFYCLESIPESLRLRPKKKKKTDSLNREGAN